MSERASGACTFLFTDIEGSTRLWEQQPKAMRAALAHHDALLRHAIEASGGLVFKTIGDAFCAVFAHPQAALEAAVAAQRALQEELPEVRVRMALHTGEAEAVGDDYLGPALNRVARLLAAGHGGQVLLSQAAADAQRASTPAEVELRPLGVHRLRDIAGQEAVFQVVAPPLPSEFPPLNTLDVAFRRGLRRATAIAVGVVVAVGGMALVAMDQARVARAQRSLAQRRERTARHYLYAAQMNTAHQALDVGNIGRAEELLNTWNPGRRSEEDFRNYEWRYLWRHCRGDERFTLEGHTQMVNTVAFSPDGKTLSSSSDDRTVRLWDIDKRRIRTVFGGHPGIVQTIAYSPDGRLLATCGAGSEVRILDTSSGRVIRSLRGHSDTLVSLAFSPDGKLLGRIRRMRSG